VIIMKDWREEREPLNMIPMVVRDEEVNISPRPIFLFQEALAQFSDARARVDDKQVIALGP